MIFRIISKYCDIQYIIVSVMYCPIIIIRYYCVIIVVTYYLISTIFYSDILFNIVNMMMILTDIPYWHSFLKYSVLTLRNDIDYLLFANLILFSIRWWWFILLIFDCVFHSDDIRYSILMIQYSDDLFYSIILVFDSDDSFDCCYWHSIFWFIIDSSIPVGDIVLIPDSIVFPIGDLLVFPILFILIWYHWWWFDILLLFYSLIHYYYLSHWYSIIIVVKHYSYIYCPLTFNILFNLFNHSLFIRWWWFHSIPFDSIPFHSMILFWWYVHSNDDSLWFWWWSFHSIPLIPFIYSSHYSYYSIIDIHYFYVYLHSWLTIVGRIRYVSHYSYWWWYSIIPTIPIIWRIDRQHLSIVDDIHCCVVHWPFLILLFILILLLFSDDSYYSSFYSIWYYWPYFWLWWRVWWPDVFLYSDIFHYSFGIQLQLFVCCIRYVVDILFDIIDILTIPMYCSDIQ